MSDTQPQAVLVDVKTRFGRVQAQVRLPPTMRLAELAWNALALDEQLIAMATRHDEKETGHTIACAKGCGACCRQAVPLAAPEAWYLADLVKSFPKERQGRVLERFAAVKRGLAAAHFDERSLPHSATRGQVVRLALDYFELGLPCPFLEDESCSIHPNRPSICREFLVTTPAALCADPRRNKVRGVPIAARLSECLSQLTAELLGQPPIVVPLPLALDWAAEHAEEGQRRFETKPMFERFIQLVNEQAGADATPAP